MHGAERRLPDWLEDIVLWGEKLNCHLVGITLDDFLKDEKTADATTKCIEAIGEASRRVLQIKPNFTEHFPNLSLRDAYQARNRLSHGYFSIDLEIVWIAATTSVPVLVEAARDALLRLQHPETEDD